ncbi:hypothetical protein CSV72_14710 [Sporosarcina sp. P20a]|uniref:hypothetical protein n=1 Tax=Sporosarcina sp. P20a TaxID=2048256 RepID=UPI000C16EEB9|nr:hypothetical protein [Sporosarcina sp. P20a]PIC85196.1 hypothetical protein CSV72_14710 [Sporosarcina sp. P20a]
MKNKKTKNVVGLIILFVILLLIRNFYFNTHYIPQKVAGHSENELIKTGNTKFYIKKEESGITVINSSGIGLIRIKWTCKDFKVDSRNPGDSDEQGAAIYFEKCGPSEKDIVRYLNSFEYLKE